MDKATFRRLLDVVGQAMERPASERDPFLADAFADDPGLLDEARALVAEAAETSLDDMTSRMAAVVDRAAAEATEPRPPERIGPYRVVRALGRGGMGVVYLGRQDAPLRRDVAIKVIRTGIADRETLARFSAERQALALMEHPDIARVFDAGATESGRPYFVMELVQGLPITEYCEREGLGIDARLELFRTVCEAVHHAHQRGIIHRDLKPSNVLVALEDGRPVPKVIDFGVAKVLEGLLADDSIHTRAGALVGTLDYMSPEQIRGEEGVDIRSDVYSLGVILYQLVSGRHPFEDTTLRRAGLLEARRILLETDPPRPSRSAAAASGFTRRRERRTGGPARRVRPDLDWVVMKALEKDRERRYPSALELAHDLERYANDEPVSAGPPGLPYRARKFVRRHRV
ncbi:MAG: protein kinase, partial [Gemmatimonadetes bacterium]|nr:serine/threonine protein kinase [Gemmatimonadota bacterium]NIQ54416.1 serine/threonine protein kinase [Gemmatimonadota bacterium]NIU74626.1 protein kinase [Gammaproteobacteria bacterium]NIX44557.1 protein kinase [Gemmatimonadota bacterium]NIY08770.1 protein kinase [Gemmatimonadota bacterium]